jgi:c-di-GMP-binding flagellar brake protein YcgR
MSWDEKRKFKRVYMRFAVEYRSLSFWQYVEARDISAGGLFLVTENVEPPKTKIEVMFEFGNNEKKFIHAEGVVAWNRTKSSKDESGNIQPAGMGIMFTKITPMAAKDFIDQMIKGIKEEKSG